VSEQRVFADESHTKAIAASALVFAAVAFGVWMVGIWMDNLHTTVNAIHALGAVLAVAGAVGTFFCAWLAIRVWQVQHHR